MKKFYEKLPEYLDAQAKKETFTKNILRLFGRCILYVLASKIIFIVLFALSSNEEKKERREKYKGTRYFTTLYPLISKGITVGGF